MIQTSTIEILRKQILTARQNGKVIGCVPTMGALHPGHLSLIEQAVQQTDFVVVSIFVNPTQFGPNEDFSKYPRPLEKDLELCQQAGADLVFCPEKESIYRKKPQIQVSVGELASRWEGASRPDHFNGVATIVTKLFHLMTPDVAFFGQKDFQQLAIIKALCTDLDFPIEIVPCPTIREKDGLALSSRNTYLSPEQRLQATVLNQSLELAKELVCEDHLSLPEVQIRMKELLESHSEVAFEYASIVDPETLVELEKRQEKMVALVAARVGKTRLIDNCEINWSDGS